MSGIERPDWTAPADDVPAPVPVREQAISRPDWDGTQPEAETPSAFPIEVSKPAISLTDRPDWPLVPDEPEDAEPVVAEEAPVDTPPLAETMIAELAETGEHDLDIAHGYVQATLDAMPDRAGFVAGFDCLPPGAQKAIIGELALPGNEYEGLADEYELAKFATTPEGQELVELWDDDADVNLGLVQARLSRIEANTSPAAIETLWDWFDNLPSAQAKAVLQELAR